MIISNRKPGSRGDLKPDRAQGSRRRQSFDLPDTTIHERRYDVSQLYVGIAPDLRHLIDKRCKPVYCQRFHRDRTQNRSRCSEGKRRRRRDPREKQVDCGKHAAKKDGLRVVEAVRRQSGHIQFRGNSDGNSTVSRRGRAAIKMEGLNNV